jgi:hypothetical protein
MSSDPTLVRHLARRRVSLALLGMAAPLSLTAQPGPLAPMRRPGVAPDGLALDAPRSEQLRVHALQAALNALMSLGAVCYPGDQGVCNSPPRPKPKLDAGDLQALALGLRALSDWTGQPS